MEAINSGSFYSELRIYHFYYYYHFVILQCVNKAIKRIRVQ